MHSPRSHAIVLATTILLAVVAADRPMAQSGAGPQNAPPAENLEARTWFQDAKFGLFVHWGVYSVLADGEWVMNTRPVTATDYEKLPALFNPVAFDAAEWVSLAKAAGMRYITITSKHHDGFAMYDSDVSEWDIVDRTPYGKDILAQLAEECRRQGLKLFFYYSQLDWHHPDYFPRGRTGLTAGRPETGNWDRYIDYMNAQLTELLTNYGDLGGIWFDGWWDRPDAPWRLDETYELIHRLQPAALIGSNHHRAPLPGEDFQMFEKDLPGQNTAGFNDQSEIGTLPLETTDTINGAWGFNLTDTNYKSTRDLIHYLVRAAGQNSNFLLNVGPMPDGRIQPEFVSRLREIGTFLERNGESIYGTRGGPIGPRTWGATTQRDSTVYVHVLDWQDDALLIPSLPSRVASATFMDGRPATFTETDAGVVIQLPSDARGEFDTVISLQLVD